LENFGLLCGMRMLGTSVALQLLQHRIAKRAFRQHALYSFLERTARESLLHLGEIGLVDAAGETTVTVILLVLGLVAGHAKLVVVDQADEVAGIDVRRVACLVLATQTTSTFSLDTAKHLVLRIDNIPVSLDLMRLGGYRFHSNPRFLSAHSWPIKRKAWNDI